MIKIAIPGEEFYDSDKEQFVYGEDTILEFEHSLASLSKWESVVEKPFLGKDPKSTEETFLYIKHMCLSDVDDAILSRLSDQNIIDINNYIESKMTATWFKEISGGPQSREIITAEIIRYWMISLKIPLEYENRHLNQLFTLIKVISEKNKPAKKMSRSEMLSQRSALNAQRRQSMGSSG